MVNATMMSPFISRSESPIRFRIPRVDFVLSLLAPRVQRVIENHAVLQHLVVIREDARKAERHGGKSRRLRREVELRGVRTAHDQREALQRWICAEPIVL